MRYFTTTTVQLAATLKILKRTSTSAAMATLLRSYRTVARCRPNVRPFTFSASARMPRQPGQTTSKTQETAAEGADGGKASGSWSRTNQDIVTFDDLDPAEVEDASSLGHLVLQQQRQLLYYMRLIEHEMPQLAGEY